MNVRVSRVRSRLASVATIGLGGLGLACAAIGALGVGLLLAPVTPGRLAHYALVAGASVVRLAGLSTFGCMLVVPAGWRPGRWRWLALAALGLGALAASVSTALSARIYLAGRAAGLRLDLSGCLWTPFWKRVQPELVTFAAGDNWRLDADLYRPAAARFQAESAPAIVVVHGGAWRHGDKSENPVWNCWLAERGYLVLDIQYRLAPRADWCAAVDDIHRAVAWLRSHADELGTDPDRIALLGRSAGGHLALLAAYTTEPETDHVKPRPLSCVVAFYAPSDLMRLYAESRPFQYDDLRAGMRAAVGGAPNENRESYRLASPLERLHSDVPATLLVHGAWDSVVPPDHSQRLTSALRRAGVRAQFVSVPFARHAFDMLTYGPSTVLAREALFAFLSAELGGSHQH